MVTQSRCKLQQLWLDFSHWDKWLAAGRRPRLLMIDVELLIEVEPPSSPDPSSESKVCLDWLLCWALIRSSSHSSRDIFLFCQLKNETQTDFTIYRVKHRQTLQYILWWLVTNQDRKYTNYPSYSGCGPDCLSRVNTQPYHKYSAVSFLKFWPSSSHPATSHTIQCTLQIWISGWILRHFDVRTFL